jgi:putative inorganic carbon (hco3(-)) transporter
MALLAVLVGVGAAVLPFDAAFALLIGTTLIVLFAITPFAALTVLLVLAPLRTLIATESALQLPLDIGQILFIMFVGVWGVYRTARRQPLLRWRWSPVYLPVLIFVIVTGITVFNALALNVWLTEWLKWLIVLVMIVLIVSMGAGRKWQWVLFALVLAGCANACVGLYIFFGGSGADHLVIRELNGIYFRSFGTFGQPNPFGGFLGLLTPIAAMLMYAHAVRVYQHWRASRQIHTSHLIMALFYAGAVLLMLGGIFTSWSRGSWLALVGALGVTVFALPRKTWQSLLFVGSMGGLIAVLWVGGLLPQSIVNRINSSLTEFFSFTDVRGVDIDPINYAVIERLAHWQAALNMAQANPWLGVGFGNYEAAYDQYRLINWKFPLGHAHNYYLNILAEAGMIGVLAYGILWGGIIWLTWRIRQHPDVFIRAVAAGLLGTWSYLAIHSLLDNLYVNNMFLHVGALLGVLALLDDETWRTVWELR